MVSKELGVEDLARIVTAYFTMWLMLNKKLEIVDRLAKWGVEVTKTRVSCLNEEEAIEHLIVQCQFDRYLWKRLLRWTQQHSVIPTIWDQFIQWSIQHGKGKARATQIFKIIFAECVYGVWIERNNRIFVKKRQTGGKCGQGDSLRDYC
ncbi:hypothetical protein MTR67_031063 [Solanum verrucosum]|uniref:Reverse transcriptase zinc-binding domain-containing protein n=1 Tax=Solanum verrucosum TaxID=315347 RepID=A0AAF0U1R5_SOLVR|nr:hypothetical protein MTR67_031063 [Solanum verrucosum]